MKTHYGMKVAPDYEIVGWRNFGGSSVPAIAPAPVNQLPGAAVAPITASEIVGDSIPDHPAPGGVFRVKEKPAKKQAAPAVPFNDPIPDLG